jgi:ABC-type Fe3+-hydroxamate transport system substrate-binding protein
MEYRALPVDSRPPPPVTDALGRTLRLSAPARRVVSLVPSETATVADLAGVDVLVGRTEYCVEPAPAIGAVPTCGGTKSVNVERVIALAPDLVLANREENARPQIERLLAAGLPVHVSFPHDVAAARALVRTIATLLGIDPDGCPVCRAVDEAHARALAAAEVRAAIGVPPLRVFVPIWADPLMTFDARTFASDLLALCGGENVFADRPRRYPLAADLGRAPPLPPEASAGRDTRYPRVTYDEVVARAPEVVLLPDEPHPFGPEDARRFAALPVPAARRGAIVNVDGKDLFWYGTRLACSLDRVRALLDTLRSPSHSGGSKRAG